MIVDDLLFGFLIREDKDVENKLDFDILNEIFGGIGVLGGQNMIESDNSFSKMWKDMFGDELFEVVKFLQESSESWFEGSYNFMMLFDFFNSMVKFDFFGDVLSLVFFQEGIGKVFMGGIGSFLSWFQFFSGQR